jgi:hypothetical protein
MKTPLLLVACVATFVGLGTLHAEESAPVELSPDQIETLVAPIALYPDPLVALILPAATHPSDVVLASRFLANGGSPDNVLSEPWDESVKALVRYREVVEYLDRNLDWTRRLGDCFLDQRDDVMDAIQAVRARARAAGMLTDSPQQEVVVEADEICIVPTNPTVIYVPRYDPVVLCGPVVTTWYPRTWITFGVAYSVGPWLRYDCDWRSRHVRLAHRPPSWYYQPDWRRHHRGADVTWTRWTPPSPRERERHRDRDFDRRGPSQDRRWTGAGETIGRPNDHDGRGDRNRSPQGDRDHGNRRDFSNRPRRDADPRITTAPGAVATAPNVPTAPTVVTQSPLAPRTPRPSLPENRQRPRRRDEDPGPDREPRFERPPRAENRPGTPPPPMVNPPPMTSSPVGPSVPPPAPAVRPAPDASNQPASNREHHRGNGDRPRIERGHARQQQN